MDIHIHLHHYHEDSLVASVDQMRKDIAALSAIVPLAIALIETLNTKLAAGDFPDDVAAELESDIAALKAELDKVPAPVPTPPAAPGETTVPTP